MWLGLVVVFGKHVNVYYNSYQSFTLRFAQQRFVSLQDAEQLEGEPIKTHIEFLQQKTGEESKSSGVEVYTTILNSLTGNPEQTEQDRDHPFFPDQNDHQEFERLDNHEEAVEQNEVPEDETVEQNKVTENPRVHRNMRNINMRPWCS